ncbi:MAG: Asp23/Gls24 family envelope stress response protein [Euzebyales bacterium]|jgi:uncharacterized alkaline shock family protein YloU|nr:Asp23/Gls24 family envelope stress response protein [Euzebyales bacterium]
MTVVSRVVIARAAAEAARAVPGVIALDAGSVGEFATYAQGTRVPGVRVAGEPPATVRVRVAVAFGEVLPDLAERVRDAVLAALEDVGAGAAVVDVHVTDVRAEAHR